MVFSFGEIERKEIQEKVAGNVGGKKGVRLLVNKMLVLRMLCIYDTYVKCYKKTFLGCFVGLALKTEAAVTS